MDGSFVTSSYDSPVQIWDVVRETFHYLVKEFCGENADDYYRQCLVGFKQFLLREIASHYDNPENQQKAIMHSLLNEMCNDIAFVALKDGTIEQKARAVALVSQVRVMLHTQLDRSYRRVYSHQQIDDISIKSLTLDKPTLPEYLSAVSKIRDNSDTVNDFYLLDKSGAAEKPFDYLNRILTSFIEKLRYRRELHDYILLLQGIEYFFLDYLIKTGVLDEVSRPFSRDDKEFAGKVKQLGELYYTVIRKIVHAFPSGLAYQPQYFAKNIIIQFFVYAVIAALNRRDPIIGPLLRQYNLDAQATAKLSLQSIMSRLVVDDPRFLAAWRVLKEFFRERVGRPRLFSYEKFDSYRSNYEFTIENSSNKDDQEIKFACQLLQQYPDTYSAFQTRFARQKEEEHNRKWHQLAYDTRYLPDLYLYLQTSAFVAKAALTGLYTDSYSQEVRPQWFRMTRSDRTYYETYVSFDLHSRLPVQRSQEANRLSYLVDGDNEAYQEIIFFEKGHLLENSVIARQYKKPANLDAVTFLQLGSIQSHVLLKIERLYIAIKEGRLDFSNKSHAVLAKQTLFEFGLSDEQSCLERVARHNPELLHRLGLLLVEKTLAMELRLMQHAAIADLLEILLKLLAIYTESYKDNLRQGIDDIYDMLHHAVNNPSKLQGYDKETTNEILAHLNAYLIMAASAKESLDEDDAVTILTALMTLKKYEVSNIILDNTLKALLYSIIVDLSDTLISCVNENTTVLDRLMQVLKPDWDFGQTWYKKTDSPCSFTCGEYNVHPLLGIVFFKGKSIAAVPFDMQNNPVYQSYFGDVNFAVMPDIRDWQGKTLDCYVSIDRDLKVRLMYMNQELMVEVFINGQYHLYLPADKLLTKGVHPEFLCRNVYSQENYRHYLVGNIILIMTKQHEIVYRWDLDRSQVHSEKHKADLVPFKRLLSPLVQSIFSRVELPTFIEIYTESSVAEQVYFSRLQLSFEYRKESYYDHNKGAYFSNEISGYKLDREQKICMLASFNGYLVLLGDQKFLPAKKIIIPHYKLQLSNTEEGCSVVFNFDELQSPRYFVYDVDAKLDFIKSFTVHASLYLGLLHYMTASLDENELSGCNGYHLAREYLELAWQAKPYSELELDTLQQFLRLENIRDLHYNRVALYLKVVSLLSHSAQFDFLYPDVKGKVDDKTTALSILQHDNHNARIVEFFAIYIRYKDRVLTRLQLTREEERDISRHLFQEERGYTSLFNDYISLNIERRETVISSAPPSKNYKEHCRQLFSPDGFVNTEFANLFNVNIKSFTFSLPSEEGVDFSSGIQGVLVDRFRLHNFFDLYEIAKSGISSLTYRYLLHHILLRSQHLNEVLPQSIIQMLGRTLLLVCENRENFQSPPAWISRYPHDYDLSDDHLKETDFYEILRGPYSWLSDNTENEKLWKAVCRYDLDAQRVPNWLPANQNNFAMQYERHVKIDSETKRTQIRALFIKAARNHYVRQFFSSVLDVCDQLKFSSQLGIDVSPIEMRTINLVSSDTRVDEETEFCGYPNYEDVVSRPLSMKELGSFVLAQQIPVDDISLLSDAKRIAATQRMFSSGINLVSGSLLVVDLEKFIKINQIPIGELPFLLQAQLDAEETPYGQNFYEDLKRSWEAYGEQSEMSCAWLKPDSAEELEQSLLKKLKEIGQHIESQWQAIEALFRRYPNTEAGHESSLALFSGQASRYHKGDILRLLLQPDLLAQYHPVLANHQNIIITLLLSYLTHEITFAKIKRALVLIAQIQQLKDKNEIKACLQQLVVTLSDSLDKESYRHPTWLLFQFEHDLILRANQRELLLAMSKEPEKVMYQLNMGEGKSTVILPLLCAELPNATSILRINVLFSLLTMMEGLLRQRLSMLLKIRLCTKPLRGSRY